MSNLIYELINIIIRVFLTHSSINLLFRLFLWNSFIYCNNNYPYYNNCSSKFISPYFSFGYNMSS